MIIYNFCYALSDIVQAAQAGKGSFIRTLFVFYL